jgi:hypothetical protein
MTVTKHQHHRAAGISAAASGLLFGLVQFLHPVGSIAAVETTRWAVVHYLTRGMAAVGAIGLTGIYLRQVHQLGVLGLIGYVLFGAFYLLTMMFTFVEAFVLHNMTEDAPHLVDNFNGIFSGADIGNSAPSPRSDRSRSSSTCSAASHSASPCIAPASRPAGRPPSSQPAPS